jgi:hypothetical protein
VMNVMTNVTTSVTATVTASARTYMGAGVRASMRASVAAITSDVKVAAGDAGQVREITIARDHSRLHEITHDCTGS